MARHWKKALTIVAFGLLVAAVVAVVLWQGIEAPREPIRPPAGELPDQIEGEDQSIHDKFVGHSKSSIMGRFGPPTEEYNGWYGYPMVEISRKYPDAVTLTYKKPAGILYLCFSIENREWVCFSSTWHPEGWRF